MLEGALATGIQGAANIMAAPMNYAENERNYQRQSKDALAYWDLQNLYNHPFNQMKRLKEAGLNPNLVYGQSAAGAAGNAAEPNRPDVNPHKITPLQTLGMYQEWRKTEANIDLADSAKALNAAKVTTENAVARLTALRETAQQFANDRDERLKEYTDELIIQQLNKLKTENDIAGFQKERMEYLKLLREHGLTEDDPYWLRSMVLDDPQETLDTMKANLARFKEFLREANLLGKGGNLIQRGFGELDNFFIGEGNPYR